MDKATDGSLKNVSRQLWLIYFNNYLLECGAITRRQHRKMFEKILIHTKNRSDT